MPCFICNSFFHNIVTCNDPCIELKHRELFNLVYTYRNIQDTHPAGELPPGFSNIVNFIGDLPSKMLLKLYKKYAIHVYIPDPQRSFRNLNDWFGRDPQHNHLLIDPNSLPYSGNYERSQLDILIIQSYSAIADAVIQGFRSGLIRERRPDHYFHFNIDLVMKNSSTQNLHCLNDECGICWDKLHDETKLCPPCGHAFCAGCMESSLDTVLQKAYNEDKQPSFPCPLCRAQVNTLFHTDLLDELLFVPLVNVIYNDLH